MTSSRTERVVLVGNPNSGKTTLFNALTGSNLKVGNYAGVTVEMVSGHFFTPHGVKLELLDLPGCYSLQPKSPDEEVTRDALLSEEAAPSVIMCVLDATHLERHLFILLQVLDLGLPTVVALNKIDLAEEQGLRIDPVLLSETYGVPFIPVCAANRKGVVELKQALRLPFPAVPPRHWTGSAALEGLLKKVATHLSTGRALQVLTDPVYAARVAPSLPEEARELVSAFHQNHPSVGEEVGKLRRQFVMDSLHVALTRPGESARNMTDRIDRWALHPFWSWIIFGVMMLTVFWSIFKFAEIPMAFIERNVVGGLAGWVSRFMPPGDFRSLIVDGVIQGVGSVLVFLPQIALLFLFIGLLETTGYMARGAFLMDRFMARFGLSGKAFLPILSGYACAIPGIMATRTISSARERLATILILPWASCSARLPVYFLLIPLLVKGSVAQTLTLFGIYVLGTTTALLAAKLLIPRLGPSEPPQFLLELPPYQWPSPRYILHHLLERSLAFVKKAGTLILGISIILWFLNTYPREGRSYMDQAGAFIEPAIRPLGWDQKTGTAMLASFAAREVFVSSLAISYGVESEDEERQRMELRDKLAAAKRPDGSAAFTKRSIGSLIIFYIFALQCLPTSAVVRRETNSWKWAGGQLLGMTLFAYLAALLFTLVGRLL